MSQKEVIKSLLLLGNSLRDCEGISSVQYSFFKELIFSLDYELFHLISSSTSITSSSTSTELLTSFSKNSSSSSSILTTSKSISSLSETKIKERILKYTRQLYDALFETITLEKAHIIATTYADEVNEADTRALVYGEIDFESFAEVLRVATENLSKKQKFIDLGHGIGRAVIVVRIFSLSFCHKHCISTNSIFFLFPLGCSSDQL